MRLDCLFSSFDERLVRVYSHLAGFSSDETPVSETEQKIRKRERDKDARRHREGETKRKASYAETRQREPPRTMGMMLNGVKLLDL